MRTRATVLAGLVFVLTVSGCGGTPKASPATSPPTTSGTPSATPTTTAEPTAGASARRVTIGSIMTVDAPAGWVVRPSPVYGGSGSVCLAPAGATRVVFDCAGVEIDFGAHLPGAHVDPYAPNRGDGWYHATDVQPCPFVPQQPGTLVGIETKPGFAGGLRPVGSHRADWNRWTATCAGRTFHPQAWFLPTSKVVIFDYLGHRETAALLASARFASEGAALATYLSAHLVSATGSTLLVQPFHTYTTDAEGKAYAKAHGLEFPFPNDYHDADIGPRKQIVMSRDTTCIGNVGLGKPEMGAAVACSAFSTARKGLPLGIWLVPGGASAQIVIEIFRP